MSSAPLLGIGLPGGRTLTDDHDGRASLAQWTLTSLAACKSFLPAAAPPVFRPAACYLVGHTPAEIVAHYFCGSARRGTLVRFASSDTRRMAEEILRKVGAAAVSPGACRDPGARLWPASRRVVPESARAVISRCNECCDTGWQKMSRSLARVFLTPSWYSDRGSRATLFCCWSRVRGQPGLEDMLRHVAELAAGGPCSRRRRPDA
jgi:hypothetical protein